MSMNFQTLFALGMKRYLPPLAVREGRTLDLGSNGKYVVPGAEPLGPPVWVWPRDAIPAGDESVATIHAYHFFEHVTGSNAVGLLREIERVLEPGGVLNYSMPYYNSVLMAQNLEHLSFWSEENFQNVFEDQAYPHEHGSGWRLSVHFQLIAGVVQRNMCLIGQLVKDAQPSEHGGSEWYYPRELK